MGRFPDAARGVVNNPPANEPVANEPATKPIPGRYTHRERMPDGKLLSEADTVIREPQKPGAPSLHEAPTQKIPAPTERPQVSQEAATQKVQNPLERTTVSPEAPTTEVEGGPIEHMEATRLAMLAREQAAQQHEQAGFAAELAGDFARPRVEEAATAVGKTTQDRLRALGRGVAEWFGFGATPDYDKQTSRFAGAMYWGPKLVTFGALALVMARGDGKAPEKGDAAPVDSADAPAQQARIDVAPAPVAMPEAPQYAATTVYEEADFEAPVVKGELTPQQRLQRLTERFEEVQDIDTTDEAAFEAAVAQATGNPDDYVVQQTAEEMALYKKNAERARQIAAQPLKDADIGPLQQATVGTVEVQPGPQVQPRQILPEGLQQQVDVQPDIDPEDDTVVADSKFGQ